LQGLPVRLWLRSLPGLSVEELADQYRCRAGRDVGAPDEWVGRFSRAMWALLKYEPPEAWPIFRLFEEFNRCGGIADILELCVLFPDRYKVVWLLDFGPCVMSRYSRRVQPRHGAQVQVFQAPQGDCWEHWRPASASLDRQQDEDVVGSADPGPYPEALPVPAAPMGAGKGRRPEEVPVPGGAEEDEHDLNIMQ